MSPRSLATDALTVDVNNLRSSDGAVETMDGDSPAEGSAVAAMDPNGLASKCEDAACALELVYWS